MMIRRPATWRVILLGAAAGCAMLGACVCSSPGAAGTQVGPDASDSAVKDAGQEPVAEADAASEASVPPKDAAPDEPDADAAAIPPELTWIVDPTLWVELKEAAFAKPQARVYEALHKKLPPLPLQWNACGAGCQWADTIQGIGERSEFSALAVLHGSSDEAYLKVQHELPMGSDFVSILRVIRLADGHLAGAVRRDMSKDVQLSAGEFLSASAFTHEFIGGATDLSGDDAQQILGRFAPDGSPWAWTQPPAPPMQGAVAAFDISHNGGQYFRVLPGKIVVLQDMHSSQWTTIEASSSAGGVAAGDGDLATWIDHGGPNPLRLRGWAPDGKGVRTLIDPLPDKIVGLGVSPARIAGFAAATQDGEVLWGARAWYSPRAYSTTESNLQLGPELANSPMTLSRRVVTWGEYEAVFATDVTVGDSGSPTYGLNYILIVHFPSWKAWRLDASAGRKLRSAYALDGNSLYATDVATNGKATETSRVYRYDLASIDQWAKAL